MPFDAAVYQVFLASPSDTGTEREVLRRVIGRWNDLHAADLEVVLLPVGWETHAVPQLGEPPQALINRQVLERCDILIGVFWTRLGHLLRRHRPGQQRRFSASLPPVSGHWCTSQRDRLPLNY